MVQSGDGDEAVNRYTSRQVKTSEILVWEVSCFNLVIASRRWSSALSGFCEGRIETETAWQSLLRYVILSGAKDLRHDQRDSHLHCTERSAVAA